MNINIEESLALAEAADDREYLARMYTVLPEIEEFEVAEWLRDLRDVEVGER